MLKDITTVCRTLTGSAVSITVLPDCLITIPGLITGISTIALSGPVFTSDGEDTIIHTLIGQDITIPSTMDGHITVAATGVAVVTGVAVAIGAADTLLLT